MGSQLFTIDNLIKSIPGSNYIPDSWRSDQRFHVVSSELPDHWISRTVVSSCPAFSVQKGILVEVNKLDYVLSEVVLVVPTLVKDIVEWSVSSNSFDSAEISISEYDFDTEQKAVSFAKVVAAFYCGGANIEFHDAVDSSNEIDMFLSSDQDLSNARSFLEPQMVSFLLRRSFSHDRDPFSEIESFYDHFADTDFNAVRALELFLSLEALSTSFSESKRRVEALL